MKTEQEHRRQRAVIKANWGELSRQTIRCREAFERLIEVLGMPR